MQNDSNVQTTKVETSRFPHSLAEDMFNHQTQFGAVLHIPTLNVSDRLPDFFDDFLESMYCADDLIEKFPEFKNLFQSFIENPGRDWNQEHATNLIRYCTGFEFLVLVESATPYNFKFNSEGKYMSNTVGGCYQMDWIFAKNMTDAAEQAIEIAVKLHAKQEQKARKEQGVEG